MPELHLDESREALLHVGSDAYKRTRSFFESFADWVLQDNVLEVALSFIIASAFNELISSFVTDIIVPPISLLPFLSRNLDEKFAVLRGGEALNNGTVRWYNTVHQARDDGALVLAYGNFLDKIIRLFILGLSLYSVGILYGLLSHDNVIKHQVKCKFCRKRISTKAKRCFQCTSWQDGREDES